MISYWGVDHGSEVSKIAVPTVAPKAAMVPKKVAGLKVGMRQGATPTFRRPQGMSAPTGLTSQRSVRVANAQRQGYSPSAAQNIASSARRSNTGGSGEMPATTVNLNRRNARNRMIAGGVGAAAVGGGGAYALGRRNNNA